MYFRDKEETNIDAEFEENNSKKNIINFILKHKIKIIIGVILLIVVVIMILILRPSNPNSPIIPTIPKHEKVTNYLDLEGEENITIIQDSDYIEFGYKAYNSKDEDLTNQVKIKSNLDTSKIGEYEITYTIGDVTKTRKITVTKKPEEYTYIYLETVDGEVNVYLKAGSQYKEPGYKVFNSAGKDLTSKVKVTGTVNTSKAGSYLLVYSVVDSNNVTTTASRTVIVMDTEITLKLSTNSYTNKEVAINVSVVDNYFDYLVLPNGTKVTDSSYSYKVSNNGTYAFKAYNKKGVIKEAKINVSNIDKTPPTGSCTIDYNNTGSIITISASDASGITKYVYNKNRAYTSNKITLSSFIDSANIDIYDKAGNVKQISCKSVALPTISSVKNDGVIVTINAKKVNADIAGYYFSYNSTRPDKNSGGYLATSLSSVDVVRLPGTTYVWVEDKSGKISRPATINLSSSVIPFTGSGYTILKGTKLSDYLKDKGWSLDELNKLMARSVRAAGVYTKEGAATAAVALEVVLIQKYGIKIPYWMGGKTSSMGAYHSWGVYRKNPTYEGYDYYGMDCDGFVNWSYKNSGFVHSSILANSYYNWSGITYSKANGEVGDVLKKKGHVAIIVGKTDSYFIVAEAAGKASGVIISKYPYNKDEFEIIKGERLTQAYERIPLSEYPTGF